VVERLLFLPVALMSSAAGLLLRGEAGLADRLLGWVLLLIPLGAEFGLYWSGSAH
jgi:hypothetical protein